MSEEPKLEDLKIAEIARRLCAHLKRLEAEDEKQQGSIGSHRAYWRTSAGTSGNRVWVVYISYQGSTTLKKAEAITYLRWLDEGNKGRHFECLKAAQPVASS